MSARRRIDTTPVTADRCAAVPVTSQRLLRLPGHDHDQSTFALSADCSRSLPLRGRRLPAETSRGRPMRPARVLVTGATGVVGRLLVPHLLARGHRVTAVGRTEEKRADLAAVGADAIALDLFDADAAARALEGHDAV